MAVRDIVFDAWTSLTFKRALQQPQHAGEANVQRWRLPTWVGKDNERRLTAYTILQAYIDNAAREFLATLDSEEREQHREYGDASVIVESIVDALLGETQQILIEEAIRDEPNQNAVALQNWFRDWAKGERFLLKMVETETNAVGLGDGVYTIGWDPDKGRARLRVYDPGFYFPVLDDTQDEDYPRRVHIAWEIKGEQGDPDRLRRITWEIAPITLRLETNDEAIERLGLPDDWGYIIPERREFKLRDEYGDRYDEDGRGVEQIVRDYPWNDEATHLTCYMTDATWVLPDLGRGRHPDDLDETKATFRHNEDGEEIRMLDLNIDFIPVIHIPNTIATQNHFGKSSLAAILQILDDLSNADTDLNAASATAGSPVIALQGSNLPEDERPTYKPGEVFETGEGQMSVMSTADALDALLKYIDSLLQRLSINVRLPESILGRVKPSEVPSGLALALSFGPLTSMVRKMRMVRDEKYPMLLKFVWRFALQNNVEAPDEWFEPLVQFGRYLPSDRSAVVNELRELLAVNAISVETCVKTLQEVGYDIDDAVEEVERILERDFLNADRLRAALQGQLDEVREYLGMKPLTDEERAARMPPQLKTGDDPQNAPDPTRQDPDNNRPQQQREVV